MNREPFPYRGPGIIELRPELHDMKIIGVEEHTTFPTLVKRIPRNSHPAHIMTQLIISAYPQIRKMEQLADNNKIRIKEMDDGGMSMQILSLSGALNSTHLGLDERVLGFERSVGEMLRSQVWISISGMYSLAPTQLAIATWGVDRILFANDYPYIDLKGAKDCIRALEDVLSPADLRKYVRLMRKHCSR